MGLEKVIVKLAFKSCLNLVKFDGALQKIAEKFDVEGCPPKEELIALNAQKNQIQSALETIAKPISVLDKTATTIDTILTALDISIKIIKKLPFPTSVPPGVGVPANVLTTLSDVLDTLGQIVKTGKGQIGGIPIALKFINKFLQAALKTLESIDMATNQCLIKEVDNSLEWSPTKDYNGSNDGGSGGGTGDAVGTNTINGVDGTDNKCSVTVYYKAIDNSIDSNPENNTDKWEILNSKPSSEKWKDDKQYYHDDVVKIVSYFSAFETNKNKYPPDNNDNGIWGSISEEEGKGAATTALMDEINLTLLDTGQFSSIADNNLSEEELIAILEGHPGLFYNGWFLKMERDESNEYPFPRRRIFAYTLYVDGAIDPNIDPVNGFNLELAVSNQEDVQYLYNDYSYSSSVEVLVNEMKFSIDTLGMDIDLSLIPPPPPPPDEKEINRPTKVIEIQLQTWGDWEIMDVASSWANEIYDLAWDLYQSALEHGPSHWLQVKAAEENRTVLDQAIRSINWEFQTGRRNLRAWIKDVFNANDEQANYIYEEARKLGRRGLINDPNYDPTNAQFLHTVKRAVQTGRFKNDQWQDGVNLVRQAVYEITWGMWKGSTWFGDYSSVGGLNLDNEWPNSRGTAPPFKDGETYSTRLVVGQDANGNDVEILGANVYDDPNSPGIGSNGLFMHGLFSRMPNDSEHPTGIPNEGNHRLTRHFKKIVWDGNGWVEIANPNAPWL